MTGPIDFADITVGMEVTATTSWVATGASSATSAIVVSVGQNTITLSNGDTITAPEYADPGTTIGFNLDEDAPAPPPPAPALGTIYTDEAGQAWQAAGTTTTLAMLCIDGTRLGWLDFVDAHPAATLMQDTPITPLPDPVSPYPRTIAPDQVKTGMDIRVTLTYDEGGTKTVRGQCVWVQDNDNTQEGAADYIAMSLATGDVFQYNPVPAGLAMAVAQMQAWTADADWPFVNAAEPPEGTVIRDAYGVAWQRITDAPADDPNPGVTPGKGRWWPVTQQIVIREVTTSLAPGRSTYDQPCSWFWLWGVAAPFNVQEPAP